MKDKETDQYIPVIGLEVHAQLQTRSKIFAADSTKFGADPNTQVSPITLGHPGVMPKVNKQAIEFAIKMGLACKSRISRWQIFDRKNYFYPDLPKGYQITQDKTPICVGGEINVKLSSGEEKNIKLNRIHLEEDAGKSMHMQSGDSFVDLNRAGVPLIELVTEPDLRSSEEAYNLMMEIRKILRYLEICDGNMEEGSLRCDANVSVMLRDDKKYGQKVEIKNMNSFRHVQKAIDYEIERQIQELKNGQRIISETRTFDPSSGKTYGMRIKEELNDYRYFPDPDLSPVEVSDSWLKQIRAEMPALPRELLAKFQDVYQLPDYDAQVLTESHEIARYFEETCYFANNAKQVSNWIMIQVKSYLNEKNVNIRQFPVSPEKLAGLLNLISEDKISHSTASKVVFPALLKDPSLDLNELIDKLDLSKNNGKVDLEGIVKEVINRYPDKVKAYRKGKKGLIGMFMGEVMKKSMGKADPQMARKFLQEALDQ